MIYAHDLVYKVLLRSSRGACGILISCIFKYHDDESRREMLAIVCLMIFPRPRVGAPLMAIVAEVWVMAWAGLVPD